MKLISILLNIIFILVCDAQIKTTIYGFPGQGSNRHIFDSIILDSSFNMVVIEYGTPEKGASINTFAKQLSAQIDTTKPFILLGVSLGGMICVELSEILIPLKTIIISSAKNRMELPSRYKFQKMIPLNELFPGSLILASAKVLQPIVEPDRNKNKKTFQEMLNSKDAQYMKRTVKLIINWDRISNSKKIYHIHGDIDHTLPIKNIKSPDYIVKNGSHMMTLTNGKKISELLNQILKN
jgi:pimeloyl-ACP methyl ester carboxylesterase